MNIKHIFRARYVILLILAIFLWQNLFCHDYNLFRFKMEFMRITHPPETVLISRISEVGLLAANGDHCDYLVGEVRGYNCSKQQVVEYYRKMHVYNEMQHKYEDVEIVFFDEEKENLINEQYIPDPILDLLHSDYGKKYVVYIFDGGYGAGIDIRCL